MEPKLSNPRCPQVSSNQGKAVPLSVKVSEDGAILKACSDISKAAIEHLPNYIEQGSYCSDTSFFPVKEPGTYEHQSKLNLKVEPAECYDEAASYANVSKATTSRVIRSKSEKTVNDPCDNCSIVDNNHFMSQQLSSQLTPKAFRPMSKEKKVRSFITPCETVTPYQAKQTSIKVLESMPLKQKPPYNDNQYDVHDKYLEASEDNVPSFELHEAGGCSSALQVNMDTSDNFFPVQIKTEPGIELPEPEVPLVSDKSDTHEHLWNLPTGRIKKERLSPTPPIASCSNALSFIRNENTDDPNIDQNSFTPSRRRTGKREMEQLYKNLKEISWAQDKDFAALFYANDGVRHSGRNASNKATANIKKEPVDYSPKVVTRRSPKSKQNVQKSTKEVVKKCAKIRATQLKCPLQHEKPPIKRNSSSRQQVTSKEVKYKDTSTHVKPVALKKNVPTLVKSTTHNKKDLQTNQLKSNKPKKGGNFTPKNANAFSEFQNPELRVKVKPLENCHPSTSGYASIQNKLQKEESVHKWKTFRETMLKGYGSQDLNYVNSVLREVQDTIDNSSSTAKTFKRSDEGVRSSLRQSASAGRSKEIVVKKQEGLWQVVFVPNVKKQNCLTIEALKELKEIILAAKKDVNCRVVLFNSSGKYFCMGIDLTQLCGSNKKHAAEEMATSIRDLFVALSTFFKPVVAAVNGLTAGLGLSLLTYCDIVYANDVASFWIPANNFGYIPEGGVSLTLLHYIPSSCAVEILLHGRRLSALDAKSIGLVSEVFYPKLMENVIPRVQKLLKNSSQAMEMTKMMARCHMFERLIHQLENERQVLPSQWLSYDCQQKIKTCLEIGRLHDC